MIGNKIPRYLILGLVLGVTVGVIMLSMFYTQYRLLASDILSKSAAEHDAYLYSSFEDTSRAQMLTMANELALQIESSGVTAVRARLDQWLADNDSLAGLEFVANDTSAVQVGELPATGPGGEVIWLADTLAMRNPVVHAEQRLGELSAAFQLGPLHAESAHFRRELISTESHVSKSSYIAIALGSLATLLMFLLFVWLIVRRHMARVKALKLQAEKLRDADFGEPLVATRADELGELASVFNDMRDRLRETTISRDYVDSILSGMNEAIIVTNADGQIKRINRATSILLGYEESELLGGPIETLVNPTKTLSLDSGSSGVPKEAFFRSKFGETIPVSYTCSIVKDTQKGISDRIYAAQNITERQRAEQRIRYLARIDALTKIPNRMQFQHLLQRSIARARRAAKPLCLFYIDIDHFKEINDTFGHLAGDATLETVAERLTAIMADDAIIGRLAGDEFAVIINDLGPDGSGPADTDKLAKVMLDRLADPFYVQGHEVFMTASLGIAYYPKDAANVIDLIRNADAALYSAKKSGGNVFAYYVPQMNEAAVERLMTKSRLKRAFERDELLVHYQPKYNLLSGEIIGAEALVRWELPDRGLILPADFIPIAEETNLIIDIGEWVLDKVCEDFRIWQRSISSPGRVSVNLSLKQLKQPNFIERINSILRGHEISPTSLELEITETTLMENPARTIKLLDQLYGLGLHLAIDDFGTGYSSLSALQQFPISTLKIDQSFVRDVATNPDDATLVGTIVQMGRNLNMDVVAEGVENEDQLSFLQRLECTYVQGLLFGEPMSSDNYLELLLAQAEGTDTHRALFA